MANNFHDIKSSLERLNAAVGITLISVMFNLHGKKGDPK